MEVEENIKVIIKKTVEESISGLKKSGLLKEDTRTPYQKTEYILYNYNMFLNAIENKREQIEEIKQYGIREKSKGITSFNGQAGFREGKIQSEEIENKINELELSIVITNNLIRVIKGALIQLKGDGYFKIISLKYEKGMTAKEIAEEINCDESTVRRNRTRIVNKLSLLLFSDEAIIDLFN